MSRKMFPAFTFFALLAMPLAAHAQGEFSKAVAQQQVAAQKWDRLINDAIDKARKLQKSPADAKAVLQEALRQVSNTPDDLSDQKRSSLSTLLRRHLRDADDAVRVRRINDDLKPLAQRPARPDSQPASGVGSASAAKIFQDSVKTAQNNHRENIARREEGFNKVGSQKDTVRIPDESGVYAPPSWFKKQPYGQPKLTEKEVALLKALNSSMSLDYPDGKFGGLVDFLHEKTGLTIIVDEASKQEVMLDYDDNVTVKIPKASVRTILKKVFGDKGLTFVVKEATIHVMTPKKASEMVVVRSYPVDDLITPDPQTMMMAQMMYGQFGLEALKANSAQQLIGLIQSAIEPSYWQANGGPGTITYFAPTKSIVVRASAEIHYQLGGGSLLGR